MNHLDLFSGIGGFAYAVDQVWPGVTHTFCEIDPFCQKVLAKHWPESKIYGDIRTITDSFFPRLEGEAKGVEKREKHIEYDGYIVRSRFEPGNRIDVLTGGFPCQPFSAAGKRKGTADDRDEKGADELRQSQGSDTLRTETPGWDKDWHEVATRFCRVDDGLPDRVHQLKALGNSIVPQVATEIMKAIRD